MYCCIVCTAAISFPVIIMLLLPLRMLLVPRMSFTREELAILDGPAASPFVSYTRPHVNFVIGGGCLAINNRHCRQSPPSSGHAGFAINGLLTPLLLDDGVRRRKLVDASGIMPKLDR